MKSEVRRLNNTTNNNMTTSPLSENKIDGELVTAKELAGRLGCSLSYVKKLKAKGIIVPAISFGRFVRYKVTQVVVALEKRSLL